MSWLLPGALRVHGGKLVAHFVRRGRFKVFLATDEGSTREIAVDID
jgi:hypothetical protein